MSGSLTAVASIAFYRAQSAGDDIKLFDEDDGPVGTLFGLRQQVIFLTTISELCY